MTSERRKQIVAMIELGVGEPWRSACQELLAELDRLRGLPVLQTCGQCGCMALPDEENPEDYSWCEHKDAPGTKVSDVKVDEDAAPPSWCPLRGAFETDQLS